jgi:hypothetical protein
VRKTLAVTAADKFTKAEIGHINMNKRNQTIPVTQALQEFNVAVSTTVAHQKPNSTYPQLKKL